MNEYYVYEWYNIKTEEVIYVGQGKNQRYKCKKRNRYFNDYITQHDCACRKIKENMTRQES